MRTVKLMSDRWDEDCRACQGLPGRGLAGCLALSSRASLGNNYLITCFSDLPSTLSSRGYWFVSLEIRRADCD